MVAKIIKGISCLSRKNLNSVQIVQNFSNTYDRFWGWLQQLMNIYFYILEFIIDINNPMKASLNNDSYRSLAITIYYYYNN